MEDKDPSWKDDIVYLVLKVRQINLTKTTACEYLVCGRRKSAQDFFAD